MGNGSRVKPAKNKGISHMKLKPSSISRRSFIKTSLAFAGAAGFPTIIPSHVLGQNGAPGANEKLIFGVIGVGVQGAGHVRNASHHGIVAAIADAYLPRAREHAEKVEKNAKPGQGSVAVYQDYRKILERGDIDAVIIATPEHWHALQAIHAAQAGKHMYCEKPLTRTIWEGRQVVKAVEKYKVVLQTGSQQRSTHVTHRGITHLRNGSIGKIQRVQVQNMSSPQQNGWPGMDIPEGLDWDMWCGPAQKPAFHHNIWSNAMDVALPGAGLIFFLVVA
jgi:hypothetical protein